MKSTVSGFEYRVEVKGIQFSVVDRMYFWNNSFVGTNVDKALEQVAYIKSLKK